MATIPLEQCDCTSHKAIPTAETPECKSEYWVEKTNLFVPELGLLCQHLESALKGAFESVSCSVEQCPDLSVLGLAAPGLRGDERLVDVGGVPNLLDPRFHRTEFSLERVAEHVGVPGAYFVGAGATSARIVGHNAEFMPCDHTGTHTRRSTYADVDPATGQFRLLEYDHDRFGLLCNLFASRGQPGPVIRVAASKGKGKDNFVSVMRQGLIASLKRAASAEDPSPICPQKQADPACQIGIGGVFRMNKGVIRAHVMPDFKPTVMVEGPEVDSWLKFYEMGPGLTFFTTFVTGDPTGGALNLRTEHTHFFDKDRREGGHYHYHITPAEAEYEGWFVPCPELFRIENPFKREQCKSSAI